MTTEPDTPEESDDLVDAPSVLKLSERDRAAFFDALIKPFEPNERLKRAFAEHRRRIGD